MTVEQKISRLLELTHTPQFRAETARASYRRLVDRKGEGELDRRIGELEEIAERVADWRQDRSQRAARGQQRPIRETFLADRAIARTINEFYESLELELSDLDHDLDRSALQALLFDFLMQEHKLDEIADGSVLFDLLRDWRGVPNNAPRTDLHLALLQSLKGRRLRTEETINSLSALAVYTQRYQPDAILAVNAGGLCISEFVKHHLSLEVALLHLEGPAHQLVPKKIDYRENPRKLLILDSAARTGATVNAARTWVSHTFPDTECKMATVAASMKVIERFQGQFYTHISTASVVEPLPYEAEGGFQVLNPGRKEMYRFGAGGPKETRMDVSAASITKRMAQLVPVKAL